MAHIGIESQEGKGWLLGVFLELVFVIGIKILIDSGLFFERIGMRDGISDAVNIVYFF